jgi:hypothetical protein
VTKISRDIFCILVSNERIFFIEQLFTIIEMQCGLQKYLYQKVMGVISEFPLGGGGQESPYLGDLGYLVEERMISKGRFLKNSSLNIVLKTLKTYFWQIIIYGYKKPNNKN